MQKKSITLLYLLFIKQISILPNEINLIPCTFYDHLVTTHQIDPNSLPGIDSNFLQLYKDQLHSWKDVIRLKNATFEKYEPLFKGIAIACGIIGGYAGFKIIKFLEKSSTEENAKIEVEKKLLTIAGVLYGTLGGLMLGVYLYNKTKNYMCI